MINKTELNILVLFGGMGTGKSTLTDFIKEELIKRGCDVYTHNIGDTCRFFSKITKVNNKWTGNERTLLQQISLKLREVDTDILNDIVLSDIVDITEKSNTQKKIVHIVTGGRTLEDFRYWNEKGTKTIGVISDRGTISQRLSTRDANQVQDETHLKHATERDTEHISRNLCDTLVINHGTLSDLESEAVKITNNYLDEITN